MQWQFKDVIVLNRYLSWFFGIGYVVIHYIYPHRHGESSMMTEGEMVPRVFFMTSVIWLLFHAVVAQKMHGWPSLRCKSLRDVYIIDAWLVLFITTPIFSVPALGASQLLMAIAWPPLALHLALNVWYTFARSPWSVMRTTWVRISAMVVWLAIIGGAAIQSFPLGTGHNH